MHLGIDAFLAERPLRRQPHGISTGFADIEQEGDVRAVGLAFNRNERKAFPFVAAFCPGVFAISGD